MTLYSRLLREINLKKVTVGVVGLGYVGSALTDATTSCGYPTIGFDIDEDLVSKINSQGQKNLLATTNKEFLLGCDIVAVCVSTPLNKDNSPNLTFFEKAVSEISKFLSRGQLIIIESSLTPGTVRNLALPLLEKSSLKAGRDFFLGYAPERIDPGNTRYTFRNIPKVVSGLNPPSLNLAVKFYSSLVEQVVPVSKIEVAEMTKFLENVFRMINISFVNELSDYAKVKEINIIEVIKAASTKPFGFLPHYPGPGAGGDCIPVVSHYLLDDAKKFKVKLKVLEAAMQVNEERLIKITDHVSQVINGKSKSLVNLKKSKVLIIGVSYKAGSNNIRGSVALKIWEHVQKMGVDISYHDPFVPKVNGYHSIPLTEKNILQHDAIIIATDHKNIPYQTLVKASRPIIDTRNALINYRLPHIIRI